MNVNFKTKLPQGIQRFVLLLCLLFSFGLYANAQTGSTITGKVVDSKGEPLYGINVVEKGTVNAVATDFDGNYKLTLKNANSTVVFSSMGFQDQEVSAQGKTVIEVKLEESAIGLDEVMVVGYGTQRKSSITGSIASLDTDKMKDITSPSVANMLQGRIAGVVATPVSGRPGDKASIRIRGLGTIQGNKEPLWVVDGVIMNDVPDLNPNDVEALSVLKDGSATALYGSRGANGVILVTTKQAKLGSSQIEASVRLGVSQLQKGKLKMMNGAEYYDYAKTAMENAGTLESQKWFQPYLRDQNTDWWDVATQSALTQNYNIGYRYGSDRVRSYISGDYYNEEGAIKGYELDRFSVRANTDYIVNNKLTLKTKLAAAYEEIFNQQQSLSHTSYVPWDTPYDSKGNLKTGKQGRPSGAEAANADPRDFWYSDGASNYLYDNELNWSKSRKNTIDVGLGFDYKIFDFLTYESNNKFAFSNYYSESYIDPSSQSGASAKGTVKNSTNNNRYIFANQMLRFLKTFDEKHEINAFLFYEYSAYNSWNHKGETSNIYPGSEILSGADGHLVEGGKSESKNAAYLFNGNYAFDSKYLFQASFRYDGSSRFGANKRWAPFWSVGAGWNMHEENFIKSLGFVNELKPRISYGITGNQPAGAYEWGTKFDSKSEYANEIAFRPDYLGNPNLVWEETGSLDFGLDFRLFNRVSVTFDAYSKKVKNLLYLRHLPAVTGYNRQTTNDGKLENKGLEITVTPEIIKTKDIYWDVSMNLGYNKNKITYMPKDQLIQRAIAVGYPYQNWYMREWAGVDPMNGDGLWFKVDKTTGEKTVTNVYDDATSVLLNSSPTPKYNGAISTNFVWKGFSVNANFTFALGAKIYNGLRAGALDRDGARLSQPPMKLASGWNRWEKPGDRATHPLLYDGNLSASSASSRYLESGDHFKMKTLSIAYSFPKKLIAPLGVRDLSVNIGAENLFTITKFSGDDPEVFLSSRYGGTTSADGNNPYYPSVRRFTMGLNVKF